MDWQIVLFIAKYMETKDKNSQRYRFFADIENV